MIIQKNKLKNKMVNLKDIENISLEDKDVI